MGSFSWTRADHTTKRSNISGDDSYKILIPKEFGGDISRIHISIMAKCFSKQTMRQTCMVSSHTGITVKAWYMRETIILKQWMKS